MSEVSAKFVSTTTKTSQLTSIAELSTTLLIYGFFHSLIPFS